MKNFITISSDAQSPIFDILVDFINTLQQGPDPPENS
jgi:hypothetical protein